jgi:serine/threonine protein kinase
VDLAGTLAYMAPESFERGAAIGPKADVYAYGLVVLEVYGVAPYHNAASLHFYQFTELVKSGSLRPDVAGLGPDAPACIHSVVQSAVAFNPTERPTFPLILKKLKT